MCIWVRYVYDDDVEQSWAPFIELYLPVRPIYEGLWNKWDFWTYEPPASYINLFYPLILT